jgi:hypothetical protein
MRKFRVNKQKDKFQIQRQRSKFLQFFGFSEWSNYFYRFDTGPESTFSETKWYCYDTVEEANEACALLNAGKDAKPSDELVWRVDEKTCPNCNHKFV